MGSAETQLREHLGEDALAYLLAASPSSISARFDAENAIPLDESQESVLTLLIALDSQIAASNPSTETTQWRYRLGHVAANDTMSMGNILRAKAGGLIYDIPPTLENSEALLARLVIDSYAALLVSNDSEPIGLRGMVLLYDHPGNARFQKELLEDETLGELLTTHDDFDRPMYHTLRSTGSGGSQSPRAFAETIIAAGFRLARSRCHEVTTVSVLDAALNCLAFVRQALAGDSAEVPVLVGMTGVVLPAGLDEIDFGWAKLRRSDARDEHLADLPGLEGQLHASPLDNEPMTMLYSGDTVLETNIPYLIKLASPGFPDSWPDELQAGSRVLEECLESVRLGLMLALPNSRPVIVSSWRVIHDPLTQGLSVSWADVKRTPGLTVVPLTPDQVDLWRDWACRVHRLRTPSISIAIRRMLSAATERQMPDDVLLDAVIVWENLFGATTETTLRVTSSLAWLLGQSSEDRMALQAKYKKIYHTRSSVVHGNRVETQSVQMHAQDAVEISLSALSEIFTGHAHLLKEDTSEKRSLTILHEGATVAKVAL